MHIDEPDYDDAARLLPILERRTGRIVVNAFAHPQEVGHATIHGGPYPATTDSRFTSVGMSSIDRFLRPVTYQGFPDALLPDALATRNPRAAAADRRAHDPRLDGRPQGLSHRGLHRAGRTSACKQRNGQERSMRIHDKTALVTGANRASAGRSPVSLPSTAPRSMPRPAAPN